MNFLRFIGGVLLSALIVIYAIVRIAFEIIGAATAPEDYAVLKQRMPDLLRWLFTTPWPVPTVIVLAIAGLAAWLLWTGTRKTAEEAVATAGVGEERVRELIQEAFESVNAALRQRVSATDKVAPAPRKLKLSTAEQERITDRLIKLDDYLGVELAEKLAPIRELRNWATILKVSGGAALHAQVEAPRATLKQLLDGIAQSLLPFEADTAILDLHPMAVKTKASHISSALLELSNVTQILPAGSTNHAPLNLPVLNFTRVLSELDDEIERVRRDIADWRRKIARGELE